MKSSHLHWGECTAKPTNRKSKLYDDSTTGIKHTVLDVIYKNNEQIQILKSIN